MDFMKIINLISENKIKNLKDKNDLNKINFVLINLTKLNFFENLNYLY